jgi:hypothetical protein
MDVSGSRGCRRFSPSLAVAMLALLVSLGGTAAAASGLITSRDIKDGTIRLVDLSGTTKSSLHANARHANFADAAVGASAVQDATSFRLIQASSTPTPGMLVPLDQRGRMPASTLPTVAARVYSSKDEPTHLQIVGAPVQRLTFDAVSFDTAHMFDPRRPSDLTAPVSGIYTITADVAWAAQENGRVGVNRAVYIYVNDRVAAADQRPPGDATLQTVTTIYKLNAGDVVEVAIGEDGGEMVANAIGDEAPALAMALIGPS